MFVVLVALVPLVGVAAAEDACSAGSSTEACRALGKEQVLLQRAALKSTRSRGDGGEEVCSTSLEVQECYHAVVWAQSHGILLHPEWYGGLTEDSSFEEFQTRLSVGGLFNCKRPCNLCHTAAQGEKCHEQVRWAMVTGIQEHPDWYSGLSSGSSFEEFQNHLHRSPHSDCPEPCDLCRTVLGGEGLTVCYTQVQWAMEHGIKQHPEWYSGLSQDSSRQEFQAYLSTKQECPLACNQCYTAEQGEPCYEGVVWAMQDGIAAHPEWYPELTKDSSFEDFQTHLLEGGFHNCPRPCPKE